MQTSEKIKIDKNIIFVLHYDNHVCVTITICVYLKNKKEDARCISEIKNNYQLILF